MTAVDLLQGLLIAAFAAGGAWGAVRFELRVLRRDVDNVAAKLAKHDDVLLDHASRLPRA